jgi:hypothetical protein
MMRRRPISPGDALALAYGTGAAVVAVLAAARLAFGWA